MALTDDQKDSIRLIVLEAVSAFRDIEDQIIKEEIEVHKKTCPVGEEFRIMKAKFVGLLFGIGISSAGIGGTIATIITGMFK